MTMGFGLLFYQLLALLHEPVEREMQMQMQAQAMRGAHGAKGESKGESNEMLTMATTKHGFLITQT